MGGGGCGFHFAMTLKVHCIACFYRLKVNHAMFKNSESDLLEIKTRIPQGSILGPLFFFSIMINDLLYILILTTSRQKIERYN